MKQRRYVKYRYVWGKTGKKREASPAVAKQMTKTKHLRVVIVVFQFQLHTGGQST